MKCPKCQFENREGAKFCKKCGNRFELKCPSCGTPYQTDSLFCDECGHNLGKPKEARSIDFDQPQSYTPKFLADKILTNRSTIEGERKLVTVFFADVANYTSMSEKLDPEEVHQIMDGCFQILMNEIHKYEGTINQFTGDGVMALFGAPLAHEDHAQKACYAALAIQRAMAAYGEKVKKDTGAEFKMRIGINSGLVVVGSIGDDLRMDYTAVGDTTNLASRMESIAVPGSIMVSKSTHRIARDFFEFKFLGDLAIKGKAEPQEAFELFKEGEVKTRIGASVVKGLNRFVGRKDSMAALMEVWERAQNNRGQVAALVGEAGVGKSRLLLEMKNKLSQGKMVFFEGRCLHFGRAMAYLPFLDILRFYFEIKEGDKEFVIKKKIEKKILELDETLKETLPSFQELLSLKVDDEAFTNLEPQKKRERTFEAVRDLMIRLSQEKPLVLAVEDLHWIDRTSEELLDYLMGWLAHSRILIILLYRPEYTHQWGSKSYYTKIGLNQLGAESSSQLVQAILEGGDVVPELRKLVLGRAGGNPLFVEELTNSLVENGSIQRKDHRYVLTRRASEIDVPDTVQGIIAARIDRLEESLKRLMQVAAVIGREFAFRLLQSIMGMSEELKAQLLNLQGLEFIYEKSLFPELEYIFKHALTQEVAYKSVLFKRRKEIHERIGKSIELVYSERLEEFYEMLAYHYSKSDNLLIANKYLKLSAEKARKNYSLWECSHFLEDSIKILNQLPESENNKREKIEILLSLSVIMRLLGFPEGSLEIHHEGERLSIEFGNDSSLAEFYSAIGVYHYFRGKPMVARRYIEDCLQLYPKIQDIDTKIPIAMDISIFCTWSGEFSKTCEVAREAIDILEATHRESELFDRPYNVYLYLCAYCGLSKGMLGDFDGGKRLLQKGFSFANDANRVYDFVSTELIHGLLLVFKGEAKDSIKHFQACIESGKKGEFFLVLGAAWTGLGLGYFLLEDLEKARRHLEEAIKIHKDIGTNAWVSLNYLTRCMVDLDLGDLKDAHTCAEKALRFAQQNEEKWLEGKSLIWAGRILGKIDTSQHDQAEATILRGIKILNELKIKPFSSKGYLFLGELHANTGQKQKALVNLKKAEGMFREMGADYWLKRAQEVSSKL